MEQGRLWLAIFLSLGLYLLYDYAVLRPYREAVQQQASTSTSSIPSTVPEAPSPEPPGAPARKSGVATTLTGTPIVVDTDLFRATIDSIGGRLRRFELKDYRAHVAPDSPALDLVPANQASVLPMTLDLGSSESDAGVQYSANKTSLSISREATASLVLTGNLPDGSPVTKTFDFKGESYVFELKIETSGRIAPVGVVVTPLATDSEAQAGREKAIGLSQEKLVERSISKITGEPTRWESIAWAGFASQYFVSLVVSEETSGTAATVYGASAVPVVAVHEVPADGVARFRVLMGPKDGQVLSAAGDHLDRALDFGWFWFIAVPLLRLLRIFKSITGNYGIAIILLTVLVKAATIPLSRAQYRSMQKMQQLQPHLERLRERNKEDPNAMQREMMELYRKHGVNPLSGCVPMILQIPIFVGLYNALLNAIELRHAPFVWWINDLSAPDRLTVAGLSIPVLVIIMGASMLVQQWMTPAQGDPTQRRMMMIMPVVFTVMFLKFPSGLVLYWLVNNVISIGQQYFVLNRSSPQGARA